MTFLIFLFISESPKSGPISFLHNDLDWKRNLLQAGPIQPTSRAVDNNHIESTDQPVFEESEVSLFQLLYNFVLLK